MLAEDEQWAKLRMIVEVAEEVWENKRPSSPPRTRKEGVDGTGWKQTGDAEWPNEATTFFA